jgi:hypothetical protein
MRDMPRRTASKAEPTTVGGVLGWMLRHPWEAVGRRWNYKSAVMSAVLRAAIFFATNRAAGIDAALAAMTTEFMFRISTAGFYGAVTQAFRRVEPPQAGTMAAMVVLPLIAHSLELTVHWWRGTPELGLSMAASVAFTTVSTAFNLFAMRRGAFVVGAGRQSLLSDLLGLPRLIVQFVWAAARSCVRAWA